MSDNVIEIMNLRKSYPGFDLGPLNLSIPRGSIVGFIGENGAGKTTTIRLILGLAHPQGGEIKIFGKDIKEDPKTIKSQLGVVFDSLNLPGDLTVMQTGRICAKIFPNWADKTYGRSHNHRCIWQFLNCTTSRTYAPRQYTKHKVCSAKHLP
jgi:ABC-2 type transport system ATP-binding protein